MAVTETIDNVRAWREVVWDGPLPTASSIDVRYGNDADELVARWDGFAPVSAVSALVEHAGIEAVGVIVDWMSGRVIGIHVYPLLNCAVRRYPQWAPLTLPIPPTEAASALVADVRALFDRYGMNLGESEAH